MIYEYDFNRIPTSNWNLNNNNNTSGLDESYLYWEVLGVQRETSMHHDRYILLSKNKNKDSKD